MNQKVKVWASPWLQAGAVAVGSVIVSASIASEHSAGNEWLVAVCGLLIFAIVNPMLSILIPFNFRYPLFSGLAWAALAVINLMSTKMWAHTALADHPNYRYFIALAFVVWLGATLVANLIRFFLKMMENEAR